MIGRGGMATVHELHRHGQYKLAEPLAGKKLRIELCDDLDIVRRFVKEAQIGMSIGNNHPNMISAYGLIEDECGMPCLLMENVQGCTLAELQRANGPLAVAAVRLIARELLSALAHLHKHSLLHRDLSPRNVLLSVRGEVKLGDFGLVKDLNETEDYSAGCFFGTTNYASPENLATEPLDSRSDLFSLGVILYELLTGTLPFRGLTGTVGDRLAAMCAWTPSLSEAIPADLRQLTLGLLTIDKSSRVPASAQQALYELAEDSEQSIHRAQLAALVRGAKSRSSDPVVAIEPTQIGSESSPGAELVPAPLFLGSDSCDETDPKLVTVREHASFSKLLLAGICLCVLIAFSVYLGSQLSGPAQVSPNSSERSPTTSAAQREPTGDRSTDVQPERDHEPDGPRTPPAQPRTHTSEPTAPQASPTQTPQTPQTRRSDAKRRTEPPALRQNPRATRPRVAPKSRHIQFN